MTTAIGACIAILGLFAFITLMIAAVSVVNGFILSTMWGWFIVPLFGLPALNIPAAIGISMVVSLFAYRRPEKNKDMKEAWADLATAIAGRFIVLFAGWVLKSYFM